MTSKPEKKLTLRDKLSRLTYLQACKLLGDEGKTLIQQGGKYEIDIEEQVYFKGDLFQLKIPFDGKGNTANASITMMAAAKSRLKWNCTRCNGACEHVRAALALTLGRLFQSINDSNTCNPLNLRAWSKTSNHSQNFWHD